MRAQRVDERVLALGENAFVSDILPSSSSSSTDTRGSQLDHRVFRKSLRMLLVGVPEAAVAMHMQLQLNQQVYEQTLGKLQATLARRTAAVLGVLDAHVPRRLVVHSPTPSVDKLTKMERVGVPPGAVEQAITFAGVDHTTTPTTHTHALGQVLPRGVGGATNGRGRSRHGVGRPSALHQIIFDAASGCEHRRGQVPSGTSRSTPRDRRLGPNIASRQGARELVVPILHTVWIVLRSV